jgi:hypothetical protein
MTFEVDLREQVKRCCAGYTARWAARAASSACRAPIVAGQTTRPFATTAARSATLKAGNSPCTFRQFCLMKRGIRSPPHVCDSRYCHYQKAVSVWVSGVRDIGAVFFGPLPDIGPACRDPNDDHVLAAAIAVEADFTVTGDKELALGQFQTVRIGTPHRFLFELSSDKQ